MKLFELFEGGTQQGHVNIKKISEAVRTGSTATILAGVDLVVLEHAEAREMYELYKQSLDNGTADKFVQAIGQELRENYSLESIEKRFTKEVNDFKQTGDLADDLYHALYDYYFDDMPYGTKKARDADPYEWVSDQFYQDLGLEETIEFAPQAELIDTTVTEGWDDMISAVKKRSKEEKGTGKFDKKTTSTGTVYTRKYNDETGEVEEPPVAADGEEKEKRGRGRPRTRPLPAADAPKRGRGRPRTRPEADPNMPKRGRGRPKKVREWIDALKYVAEGKK